MFCPSDLCVVFFFKQKTAYEMRISDWSSDVCSSDLIRLIRDDPAAFDAGLARRGVAPLSAQILAADADLRALQTDMQAAQARRNDASKAIGQAMAKSDRVTAAALKAEVAALKQPLPDQEPAERAQPAALPLIHIGTPPGRERAWQSE